MSAIRYDKEIERFRNLMLPPGTFEEGFRWSSLIGALFIALLLTTLAQSLHRRVGRGH